MYPELNDYHKRRVEALKMRYVDSADFIFLEDKEYKNHLARKSNPAGEIDVVNLYRVTMPDGVVCYVLAESGEGAAMQASCGPPGQYGTATTYDFDKREEMAKASKVEQVPFRIRGWGAREF